MKTSKAILRAMMLAAIFATASCEEPEIDSQKKEVKFYTDAAEAYTCKANNAEPVSFEISSNTPWTIKKSDNKSWCTVSPTSSATSSLVETITLTFENNTSGDSRSMTLTITADDVEKPTIIDIVQEGAPVFQLEAPDVLEVPTTGGNSSFTVISNRPWEVKTNMPEGVVNFSRTGGTGTGEAEQVDMMISQNNGQARNIIITVSIDEENSRSFTMTQEGFILEIEGGNSVSVWGAGQTKEVKVNSSIPWTIEYAEDPYTVITKKDENTIQIAAKTNPVFKDKTTIVTVMPEDAGLRGDSDVQLTVTQSRFFKNYSGNPAIAVDADGAATVTDNVSTHPRYYVDALFGLGTYVWKFNSIDIQGGGALSFTFNSDANKNIGLGDREIHVRLGEGHPNNYLWTGGPDFWVNPVPWTNDLKNEDLNKVKEIKLVFVPKEDDITKLVISIYFDDVLFDSIERKNLWNMIPEGATGIIPVLFGLAPNSSTKTTEPSTIVMKSMEYIPYN